MKMIAVSAHTTEDAPDYFYKSCLVGEVDGRCHINIPNIGLVGSYQFSYETYRAGNDVIVFMHDDVEVFESECRGDTWGSEIARMFESDPKLAIVGLGGATGIGTPDIYKTPYHITQLQRTNYASNQHDWAVHGTHETGIRDVAVVDGFFMAVRTKFLDEVGGWKWFPHTFHQYDNGLCLMAHRRGWKVKTIGLDCHHHGGGTSTTPAYEKWCEENGTTMAREHEIPHAWFYDFFRNELPFEVKK